MTRQSTFVLAVSVLSACGGLLRAQPEGWYFSETDYDVGYPSTQLPDFDQVRQFSDQTPALPGEGRMYCAPTTTINLMAYLANTVTPFIRPYPETWTNYTRLYWDQPSIDKYNQITEAIREMGSLMNTSPTGGSSMAKMVSATEQWLDTHSTAADLRDIFEVSYWGPDGRDRIDNDVTTIKPEEMAQFLWRGDVLAANWGYYQVNSFAHVLEARHGGHVITPYRVNGDSPFRSPRMDYRNPSGSQGDTTVQQDVFNTTTRDLSKTYFQDLDGDTMQRYGVFKSLENINDHDFSKNLKIMDGVMTVSTRGVFAITPGFNPVVFDYDAYTGSIDLEEFEVPNAENIKDAELSPDKLHIVTLTVGDGSPNSAGLYVQNLLGDLKPVLLDVLSSPIDVCYNRQRCVIVLAEEHLSIYNPYLGEESRLARIDEPGRFDAMDVNDADDELYLYSSHDQLVQRRDARDLSLLSDWTLPVDAPRAERLRVNPFDGSLWVLADGQLHRFTDIGDNFLAGEVIEIPLEVACFSFDERGHLFLGEGDPDDMIIRHFQAEGNRVQHLGTSPFDGLEVPGCFDITRGRINLDHDLHLQPGSYHVDPTEQEPEDDQTPDPGQCPADMNGDGIVDNGDIGTFVNLFLVGDTAADFNGDGILDNGDIGAFVAAFLAGC